MGKENVTMALKDTYVFVYVHDVATREKECVHHTD